MFKVCEDIKFLEELIESNKFRQGFCIVFTNIQTMYTRPTKRLNPKNPSNLALYEAFRINKEIKGNLSIKTGNMQGCISLKGSYNIEWMDAELKNHPYSLY